MKAKTSTTCTLSWQRTGSYRARALRLGVRPFSSLPPRVLIHFRFSNDLPTLLQHVEKRRLNACVRGHVISTRQSFVSCGMRHVVRHTRHMAHVAQESKIDETIIKDENDM